MILTLNYAFADHWHDYNDRLNFNSQNVSAVFFSKLQIVLQKMCDTTQPNQMSGYNVLLFACYILAIKNYSLGNIVASMSKYL